MLISVFSVGLVTQTSLLSVCSVAGGAGLPETSWQPLLNKVAATAEVLAKIDLPMIFLRVNIISPKFFMAYYLIYWPIIQYEKIYS